MIYFAILFMLILFSYAECIKNARRTDEKMARMKRRWRWLYIISAASICLLAACRFQVGQDWSSYVDIFRNCNSQWYWQSYEHGYMLLNRFFKSFTNNYYWLQFAIDIVCGFIIFREIYRKSSTPIFLTLVYFICHYNFAVDMTMNRMHIALAIVVLGSRFIEKKKLPLWIGMVLLAMQFHVTAVIAIPLYWTSRIRISRRTALILLGASFLLTISGLVFTINLMNWAQTLSFLPGRLSNLMRTYMGEHLASRHQEVSSGLGFIMEYLFYFFLVMVYRQDNTQNKNQYMLNFLLAILIQAFGANFDLLKRFANYYMISGYGIVAYNLINEGKYSFAGKLRANKKSALLVTLMVLTLFILFRLMTYIMAWNSSYSFDYAPYRVFF